MAYPRRRKGFRPIHVDGGDFLWRFHPGPTDSVLVAQSADQPGQRLTVCLRGWRDPWLAISGFTVAENGLILETDADNDPEQITSRFARVAIQFALAHGWQPGRRSGEVKFDFMEGRFYTEGTSPRVAEQERCSRPFQTATCILSNDDSDK